MVNEDPFSDDRYLNQPFTSIGKGSISLKRLTFTKADRIRTSQEYRKLSKKGKRHYSDLFIIVFRKTKISVSRLGITVSKKVGKAVTRNRIKRIIREYFRVNKNALPDHFDVNIIARHTSGRVEANVIRAHLASCFVAISEKAGHENNG